MTLPIAPPTARPAPSAPRVARIVAIGLMALTAIVAGPGAAVAVPTIDRVAPGGGRQGSETEIVLSGRSLGDVRELFFESGAIRVTEVANLDGNRVRARIVIPSDCPLGNHRLRLRTATGLSDLRLFRVGALEHVAEREPNGDVASALPLEPPAAGTTVTGVITSEDVDLVRVRARAGERIAAAVDAVRLEQEMFDPALEIVAADGTILAERDDHPLLAQDAMLAAIAPTDGEYFIRLRESAYGGNDGCVYLLHVGAFPVPAVAWPPGGTAGSTIDVEWLGDPTGPFTARVEVPTRGDAAGLAEVRPVRDGIPGPVGVPLRVSSLPLVTEEEANDEPQQATRASAPASCAGRLGSPGDVDWLRIDAPAGSVWSVRAFGHRLGAPVDLVVAAHQSDAKRGRITSNDDGDGPDSQLRVTTPAEGSFLLRISDHQRRGGADFVWWLDVEPITPAVDLSVPPGRNNTQDRLVGSVPRGNRTALVLNAARTEYSGAAEVFCRDLPAGVQATVPPLAGNAAGTFVVLEAGADASESTGLSRLDVVATEAAAGVTPGAPLGGLRQTTAMVFGLPNNTVYRTSLSDRLPVAVVGPAPIGIDVEPPAVPLVRGGTLDLVVHVARGADAKGKVRLGFPFKPTGIAAQTDVDVADGADTGSFTVSAKADAPLREWDVVVTGLLRGRDARDDGGALVCSRPVRLQVIEPLVEMTVAKTSAEIGTTARLVGTLTRPPRFTGKAQLTVRGLPTGVTADDVEMTAEATEVVVPIRIDATATPGKHDTILFEIAVPFGERTILHRMPPTQLRIDRPLQTAAVRTAKDAP